MEKKCKFSGGLQKRAFYGKIKFGKLQILYLEGSKMYE